MIIKLNKRVDLNLKDLPRVNLQDVRKKIAHAKRLAKCPAFLCRCMGGRMESTNIEIKSAAKTMAYCVRCGRVRFQ